MKRVILSVSYVAILGLIASCNKEKVEPTVRNSTMNTSINDSEEKGSVMDKASGRRVWFDNGGKDYGCKGSGGNCLPDVIVTPKLMADIRGIGEVILHGNADEIKNEFNDKKASLQEVLNNEHILGVINGKMNVSVKGLDTDVIYMLFSIKSDKNTIAVYPIK